MIHPSGFVWQFNSFERKRPGRYDRMSAAGPGGSSYDARVNEGCPPGRA